MDEKPKRKNHYGKSKAERKAMVSGVNVGEFLAQFIEDMDFAQFNYDAGYPGVAHLLMDRASAELSTKLRDCSPDLIAYNIARNVRDKRLWVHVEYRTPSVEVEMIRLAPHRKTSP
jgi:hypothetical protein